MVAVYPVLSLLSTVLTDEGVQMGDVMWWDEWMDTREQREGESDDITVESLSGQSPQSPSPPQLPSLSTLPHFFVVATAAAASRLVKALFGVDSNAAWCTCDASVSAVQQKKSSPVFSVYILSDPVIHLYLWLLCFDSSPYTVLHLHLTMSMSE